MSPPVVYGWRFWVVLFFLIAGFLALAGRLIDLAVFNRDFLVKQGQMRALRVVAIPAYRGMILDRNNQPLAISTPVDSVWVNPAQFHPGENQIDSLAKILQMPESDIKLLIASQPTRNFIYLKRGNSPDISEQISALKIPGIYFQREYKRFYPEAEVTSHLVGLTNVDDRGQEGLELAYDQWLAGKPGKKQVIKDRLGNIISELALLQKPEQGHDLVLSIDKRIQYSAYQALKAAVTQYQAESGSVVVLDARTGEVLAMVNQPSFNPNNRPKQHDGRYRNRAVTDMYEPGSTLKTFTLALALASGKYTPNTIIDTRPGWMNVGGYRITDDDDFGVISLKEVLAMSSNIGATKIMMSLSPQDHWKLLHAAGFGELTGSGFPGEAAGRLAHESIWRPSEIATLAYGYGLAVTTLQLAHAYSIFANGGVLRPLSLLRVSNPPAGTQVISPVIANKMLGLLENDVADGKWHTGTRAQIPGYRVGGKTGTSYIAGPHGYDHHKYNSSFVGIAPLSNPRLVIAVYLRDPHGSHMGAMVSAPVFAQVMSESLRILNVFPDQQAQTANTNNSQNN
ncbi:MAG: penicillin-binding protein 2 [Proteobacteria bacterium]|nr:penicillin-binding protein 2 [Pseudomonadota bacterium]